jgi:DNA-binding response OmpR family regulator
VKEANTERRPARGAYVLVVHDDRIDVAAICDAIRAEFIVREASTAFDALERLAGTPLACVVCVIGGSIKGHDFYTLALRATPDQVRRMVFVTPETVESDERQFLEGSGVNRVSRAERPAEILAVVRAVSTLR